MDFRKWQNGLEEISVFPLPRVVLFPGSILPLHIDEERYKLMTEELLKSTRMVAMHQGECLPGAICGGGKVELIASYPDGRKDIFVEAKHRFQIIKCLSQKPYFKALAKRVPDIPYPSEVKERGDHQKLSRLVQRWIFLSPDLGDRFIEYVSCFPKSHQLADFIAFSFLPSLEGKQKLLETVEREKRVTAITSYMEREIRKLEGGPHWPSPFGTPNLLH